MGGKTEYLSRSKAESRRGVLRGTSAHRAGRYRDPQLAQYAREHRNKPTVGELAFWGLVRRKQLGTRWHRQYPVCVEGHRYILDFYCPSRKLAVEVDGGYHNSRAVYDERRTEWLATHGIRVLRFTNEQVLNDHDAVLQILQEMR